MKLLFLHGWGFDRHVWGPVQALLADHDCLADDRGYFGEPQGIGPEGPCIAVTHSFGTMRLLAAPPPGLTGIVAINGFARFTATSDTPGVAPRVLDRMLRRFEALPRAVLDEFRRTCGAVPLPERQTIDAALLHADLVRLRDDAPAAAVPLVVIHGDADPLLPEAMRAQAFPGAQRINVAGGHLLPLEAPDVCAAAVRRMAAA